VALAVAPAHAQDKITRIVVAFPAGGPADLVARVVADELGKELNRRVIVGNGPGTTCSSTTPRPPPVGIIYNEWRS
jgi:tripartite-type tricarboxylate transporter receptor subunit TctC